MDPTSRIFYLYLEEISSKNSSGESNTPNKVKSNNQFENMTLSGINKTDHLKYKKKVNYEQKTEQFNINYDGIK